MPLAATVPTIPVPRRIGASSSGERREWNDRAWRSSPRSGSSRMKPQLSGKNASRRSSVARASSDSSSVASAAASATPAITRCSSSPRRRPSSTRFRSVTSTSDPRSPRSRPCPSTHPWPRASSQRTAPSGQTTRDCTRCTSPGCATARATAAWKAGRSSGWMCWRTCGRRGCPSEAPAPAPKRRLASADHHIAPVSASISQMAMPDAPRARESRSSLWRARRSASWPGRRRRRPPTSEATSDPARRPARRSGRVARRSGPALTVSPPGGGP